VHGVVESTEQLTPALIRVVLVGPGLVDLAMPDGTDAYVNIAIPPADAPYGPLFDLQQVREQHPPELQPARRRYTVRRWQDGRLTLDFVVHGDTGVAGPWAAAAGPGDVLVFTGPSSGYRPSPDAAWHLLVGDEAALPAIAASLEVLPAGVRAVVRLLCDGPDYVLPIDTAADVDLQWLYRTGDVSDPELLVGSVRDCDFAAGPVHAFVHGEADEIRALRRHLLADRGLTRADMSCSPYWRRTMTDEAWRRIKKEYVAAMDADVA
jgi:NADPH-dependent ferric siderophore reductase